MVARVRETNVQLLMYLLDIHVSYSTYLLSQNPSLEALEL